MNNFILLVFVPPSTLEEGSLLAAGLVDAAAPDVTHPFNDIMIAVVQLRLEDLQVAHFQP